jgi:hypothetical protein
VDCVLGGLYDDEILEEDVATEIVPVSSRYEVCSGLLRTRIDGVFGSCHRPGPEESRSFIQYPHANSYESPTDGGVQNRRRSHK